MITQPPHPIDVRLRRASTEWLQEFATKAELPMISALLGEASQGIYSVRQITEIMFAYRISQEELASSAPKVLSLYENIQGLGCVMNGEDRKNGSMMPGRFGIDKSQIQWCWDFVESDD